MGFISRHITPLVINSLRAVTHTNTHTDDPQRINFKKPGAGWPAVSVCLVYEVFGMRSIPFFPILFKWRPQVGYISFRGNLLIHA